MGEEKCMYSVTTGAKAQTRDLPCARPGSVAAHHGGFDKLFPGYRG